MLVLDGEAGVETIVMTGCRRTSAGWTISDIGGASDCMGVEGSYICRSMSGRAGMFKCKFRLGMGTGSLSLSSETSASGSSLKLIPLLSSYLGLCWCEQMGPTPSV